LGNEENVGRALVALQGINKKKDSHKGPPYIRFIRFLNNVVMKKM